MGLARGNVTVLVLSNDYGKPRPVVILQSDSFQAGLSFVVVPFTSDLLTSDLRDAPDALRIRVQPSQDNGLRVASDLMVDKLSAVPRSRAGEKIGRLEQALMESLTAAVALLLGF